MFSQQLADCAHELTPRVNLQKTRPSERSTFVNAIERSGNLCCTLVSQRLCLFVAGSDVNHGQCILVNAAANAVVWQLQKISLVDRIR